MSLYIRDAEVNALARKLQMATKAATKTDAVRTALRNELERARTATPLRDRIKRLQEATRALGPDNPNFDMKAFMDREWDGL